MHVRRDLPDIALKFLTVTLIILFAGYLLTIPAAAEKCKFTKTNRNCEITLDRNSFVFPAPLQLYPGAVVTVRIRNGNDFELYTLDPAPGQASLLPDVISSAITNLNTIFAAAGTLSATTATPPPLAEIVPNEAQAASAGHYALEGGTVEACQKDPNGTACKNAALAKAVVNAFAEQKKAQNDDAIAKFNTYLLQSKCDLAHVNQFSTEQCMLDLLQEASNRILATTYQSRAFYTELNTLLTPDAQPPLAAMPIPNASRPHIAFEHLLDELCGLHSSPPSYYLPCGVNNSKSLIDQQAAASAFAAALLTRMTKPPSDVSVPDGQLPKPPSQLVLNAMQLVTEEQAALDAIRKDLEGYASRLQDLAEHPRQMEYTVGYIQDPPIGRHGVTRTVNYTLNRLNLVSNSQEAANDGSKKVPIVTVSVVYGEAHWEASTGIALAFRPTRTFTVAPIISDGVQTDSYISESKAIPQVVPFVAADFRIGSDFKLFGWRGAFYGTGGVGYNISQVSADYLVGPSISWRGLLLSGLCDFGHGTHLAENLTAGDHLGAATTVTTVPTMNYWVPAFAVGISYRIPGITGR